MAGEHDAQLVHELEQLIDLHQPPIWIRLLTALLTPSRSEPPTSSG